ncbi:MAG TPA: copper homeostasis protein CutC [Cytophagales bacterium]|nr:copper homeostasis protein CutC [Cytophagales bacterium]
MIIEVVVYNIESALKAQAGGADRIELCDNPLEGGTTPSFGVIEGVRQNVSMDLYVMIRPRGGDFVYNNYDFYAMKRDIDQCMKLSADGVVFGILTPEARMDVKRCRELIQRARPMKVTCHRAFDVTRDAFEALEDCIEAGFDRILTSGRMPTAPEGETLIKQLVERAAGRITLMAGAGITDQHVKRLVDLTGIREVHFSATRFGPPVGVNGNHFVSFLSQAPADYRQSRMADAEIVVRVRNALGG